MSHSAKTHHAIRVDRCAAMASVQDNGRRGLRHLGIGLAGAADLPAAQIANLMLGNDLNDAVLELTLGPCHLTFLSPTRIALTGADFGATLDDRIIAPWWSVPVRAGQTLQLRGATTAQRCYLAVSGGIQVPFVHGSRSTDMGAGFGGYQGRMLRKGDILPLSARSAEKNGQPLSGGAFGIRAPFWHAAETGQLPHGAPSHVHESSESRAPVEIRVLPAPEYIGFSEPVQKMFWESLWTIGQDSNRMGLRLAGPLLLQAEGSDAGDLASHAVMPGVIQVPPGGRPIVLMQDAQTTGGYPRIGVVIRADVPRLAQLMADQTIRFEPCDAERAHAAYRQQQDWLADLATRLSWQDRVCSV